MINDDDDECLLYAAATSLTVYLYKWTFHTTLIETHSSNEIIK